MAISIPTQIEQDFHSGKAQYKTFQTGFGAQSSITVDPQSYIIIYGYNFYPAGGAVTNIDLVGSINQLTPDNISIFGTQQISFWTQDDFFPFLHNVNIQSTPYVRGFNPATGDTTLTGLSYEVDTSVIDQQTFIKCNRSVAIQHGVASRVGTSVFGLIPGSFTGGLFVSGLTYGNTTINVTTETSLGAGGFSNNEFLQPVYKGWDLPPYSFGLIPPGGTPQAFFEIGPNMLTPAQNSLDTLDPTLRNRPNANYFLTVHYALYSQNER